MDERVPEPGIEEVEHADTAPVDPAADAEPRSRTYVASGSGDKTI